MYVVQRQRGNNEVVLMQDDGHDYYMCLERPISVGLRYSSRIVIVVHPQDIVMGDLIEYVTVGPLPLSLCHRLAIDVMKRTRGFESKRMKLEYNVKEKNMTQYMYHWISPFRPDPMSCD